MKTIILKRKTAAITALILLLAISIFATNLPFTAAQGGKMATIAFLAIKNNPIGIGQEELLGFWVTPRPTNTGEVFYNYYFTITKPDGTTDKWGPLTSYTDGSQYIIYKPDQLGTYTAQLTWEGDATHQPCQTEKQPFVVQQDPIPSWPATELPTDYWSYPINAENREWSSISGSWLQSGTYDASRTRYNPYTLAPQSAHVLWKKSALDGSIGGIIGGQWGNGMYYGGSAPNIGTIIAGRGYYTSGGKIYCIDMKSGEPIWTVTGTFNEANDLEFPLTQSYAPGTNVVIAQEAVLGSNYIPYLLNIGSRLIKYNAFTGAMVCNVTGMTGDFVAPYVYTVDFSKINNVRFIKWDTTGTSSNFSSRIVYNVSYPLPFIPYPGRDPVDTINTYYGDIGFRLTYPIYGDSGAINLTTGQALWHKPITDIQMRNSVGTGYGYGLYGVVGMQYTAIDLATGNTVWKSNPPAEYPWGEFWCYATGAAYGLVIASNYDGYVYAINAKDGQVVWKFYSGDAGMEEPYGHWSWYQNPIEGGGLIFSTTGEHSPSQPYYRGQFMVALDSASGKEAWRMTGYFTLRAIANGIVTASNIEDGFTYAFGRGNSSTTISIPTTAITNGESTWISGTVMDQSPAQPNTPAVSKASMTQWMGYLHQQKPKPTNTTGVSVTLTATKSDGSQLDIGNVVTDATGRYKMQWTPPKDDLYVITASFAGDESYYLSQATTELAVTPSNAPSATATPAPVKTVNQVSAEAFYVFAFAIVAILAIIAVLFYRKK